MQYRRKNQMSPDLFSLPGPDPATLKTQKWFLIFQFWSKYHLDLPTPPHAEVDLKKI